MSNTDTSLITKIVTIKNLKRFQFLCYPIIVIICFILCTIAVYQDNEYNYTWAGNMQTAYIICVFVSSVSIFISHGVQKNIAELEQLEQSSMIL